ncbi:serine/threonine-protein kinase PAK 3-like [Agelaius tricolor]
MPWQTQGELFPAREQEEQLRQQVEEPQENGQKIQAEPQAELPEAQSDIVAVKRKNKEDMRRIQEENLHQQRGDQQNQVSERVAGTPLMKHPLSCFLEKMKEQLDAELQTAHSMVKARQKRLEEEMKIIREKLNCFRQSLQKQVRVLTSHWAACEDFQRMSGNEGPQVCHEAQEQCPPERLQVQHVMGSEPAAAAASPRGSLTAKPGNSSLGTSFMSLEKQTEEKYLEMLGRMVNPIENPVMKYTELEYIGSGSFGDVCRALDNATGREVAIKIINLQELRRKELTVNEIMIMKKCRSPNVVNYLDSYFLGEELLLVMEYMDGGALTDVISKTYLSEDEMAAISRECLQGLYFLHSKHVIHRDVKSENILLRTDGSVKLGQYILGQVQHSRDVAVGLLGVTASSPKMLLVAAQGHPL